MTSERHKLERALWRSGPRCGVLLPTVTPSLREYPCLLPDGVTLADVSKRLEDIRGRLALPSLRCEWRDGVFMLSAGRVDREVIRLADMKPSVGAALPLLLGVTSEGAPLTLDLASSPHILVSGTSGSGKSNSIQAALCALISHKTPTQARVLLADGKGGVDFAPFADAAHVLAHLTEPDHIHNALTALCDEASRRYRAFAKMGARSLAEYEGEPLPYILAIVDEVGVLVDAHKDLLTPLTTLLQSARGAGIHLCMIAQRPDEKTITPRMRLNLAERVAFRMPDAASSRLVVGDDTASALMGRGDGVLLRADGERVRFQSPLASREDIRQALALASQHEAPTWRLEGVSDTFSLPVGVSQYEALLALLETREYISTGDVLEAGIANSRSQGKKLLSQARDAGHIGEYVKDLKKSRVTIHRTREANTVANENAVTAKHDQLARWAN